MAINTLFQLLAVKEQAPEVWRRAKRLLFMPDLFIHALCGAQVCERTIASTSQMQDARTGAWDRDVLAAYRIPERLFAPSVPSGTVVGALENGAKVVAVAGHDTQCAVAGIAHTGAGHCVPFLWDMEPAGVRAGRAGAHGREHAAGPFQRTGGQWPRELSEEHHRPVAHPGEPPGVAAAGAGVFLAELESLALEAAPLRCFINPDDPAFTPPGRYPGPRAGILRGHRAVCTAKPWER